MMASLARFQERVSQALYASEPDAVPEFAALASQPGFAVYRNTVMKGCIDALQANYPSVARLVGEEWFRAAATAYACVNHPKDARMLYYGENFPDFLARFEPAAGLPYLPDVARLDRFWTEAHAARDEPPLAPVQLSHLAPEALAETVLYPHAAARWKWFSDLPIYTIWRRNRELSDCGSEIEWRGEGALLVRPYDAVAWIGLDAAGCAFLDACMAGLPLGDAAAAALGVDRDADLARLLSTLLDAGAFGRIMRIQDQQQKEAS
ncbi:MAG TPA: putative DNA-binding domain-containing protein [Noviherbaspirillum sp.]|nr:putative DNA-binding domain-containing protein [Noviherbaspirillum sp.]